MVTFSSIIDAWPTRAAFASDLGISPAAALNMRERNSIPARYWTAAVRAAFARNIPGVSLETFAHLAAHRPMPSAGSVEAVGASA